MKEIKKLLLEESLYYFNNFINNNINQKRYYAYNEKTKLDIHNADYVNVRVRPKKYPVELMN